LGLIGKEGEERAGFRVKSEQSARKVSSTTIECLKKRSGGAFQNSMVVNSRQHEREISAYSGRKETEASNEMALRL
jgi:hypothetical protein